MLHDASRDTMIPEIREASWTAPALWRFARRWNIREVSVRTGLQALGAPTTCLRRGGHPSPVYFSRTARMESSCLRSMSVAVPATMCPAMLRKMWALSGGRPFSTSLSRVLMMVTKVLPL